MKALIIIEKQFAICRIHWIKLESYWLWFILLSAFGCTSKTIDLAEQNRALGKRYFEEVWNKGNTALLDTILASSYINHTPSAPTQPGPEGLKPIVKAIRRAFPDLHYEIKELISNGDYLTIRVIMTGTQRDSLFSVPPTGRSIKVMQINIEKIKDGKITEHWRVTDELTMMKQLGLVK